MSPPATEEELASHYSFSERDFSLIRQRRGDANRLGFAVQLCLLRFPGRGLEAGMEVSDAVLQWVGRQLRIDTSCWPSYASRAQTRREHLVELRSYLEVTPFRLSDFRRARLFLCVLALQTDKGALLAAKAMEEWRRLNVMAPPVEVLDRLCSSSITHANRKVCALLADPLSMAQRDRLDAWLRVKPDTRLTWITWLRQSPVKPNSRHMMEHIDRLKEFQMLGLPEGFGRQIHQNRLLKMAREGGQMTSQNLGKFESQRKYATLVAVALEGTATVIDQIVDLHDRIIGKLLNGARHRHEQRFQQSGRKINDQLLLYGKVGHALMKAREDGADAFAAIETVLPWAEFAASVVEANKLSQPEEFDFIHLLAENYPTIRRYAPALLEVLQLRAAPAGQAVLEAVEQIRALNASSLKELPSGAPTAFIKKRWEKLIRADQGLDRRNYELCALCELKNALRSGDIWVKGSRQFKDFEDYLIPAPVFGELKKTGMIPLSVTPDAEAYLKERIALLEEQLEVVNGLALSNHLPDALITEAGLKMTPLDAAVAPAAQSLIDRTAALLPHIKITELLLEVDEWTDFTRHFTHLKTGDPVKDKTLLLTTILADAINLGLVKMASSSPGITHPKLSWVQAWYIRDDTYAAALSDLVNTQLKHPFAVNWGDGTTSSSDGQRFKSGGRAESTGHVNPKYGSDPGRMFYTHISDQYSPFSTKVVNVGVRDATYVLDGLLYHESDLRIEEHYTDTAGFTDHVFGMMHLLGFRFAPRIRDLNETRLFVPKSEAVYPSLKPLIGGRINLPHIKSHWDDLLRLASSIRQGTVTASLILRKLAAYPRQNGLAVALREVGRIERTLFILTWLQSTELRRRVHAGLNKGEARNALARAVFFHRLGEIRDRSFDQQRYRASGLSLVIAAIVLWNTTYLERASRAVLLQTPDLDDQLLRFLSPLGWEHINLSGDYLWPILSKTKTDKFRPLRRGFNP